MIIFNLIKIILQNYHEVTHSKQENLCGIAIADTTWGVIEPIKMWILMLNYGAS